MRRTWIVPELFIALLLFSQVLLSIPLGSDAIEDDGTLFTSTGPEEGESRSMWLEGYQIINHSEVLKVIDVALRSNINCLCPLINGHYLGVFYNSSYHPRYPELKWDFDPLMDLIKEAHKYGIKVIPWFHTMLDYHALKAHPEWGCTSSTGYRSNAWLNPSLPQVGSFLANVSHQLVRDYPIDGIKLDTIRYPGSNYGYDTYSIERYQNEGWSDFNAFRREMITECQSSIYDAIVSVRPYILIGADIFNSYSSRQYSVFQDSEIWAREGRIDFVTPMIYTASTTSYNSTLRDNIARHSCSVVGGTYVFTPGNTAHGSVPDEQTGIRIMLTEIEMMRNAKGSGVCLFAYKFLLDFPAYVSSLKGGPFSDTVPYPEKAQRVPVDKSLWEFEKDHDRDGWRTMDMGHFYPFGGVWSVTDVLEPTFESPLLHLSAKGTNVLELSMRKDTSGGDLLVQWTSPGSDFDINNSLMIDLRDDREWNLYSIHLDRSLGWSGSIGYLRVRPIFEDATNITIDLIRVTWMPDCIKEWSYLGPFMNGQETGMLTSEFLEDEGLTIPRTGTVDSGRIWRHYSMDRDLVDLRFALGRLSYSVAYAHVLIECSKEGQYELRTGSSDGIVVWLNGEEVTKNTMARSVSPDQNVTVVALNEGFNPLMVKLAVYTNEFAFYLRFTELNNLTALGLKVHSDLPEPKPPVVISDHQGWSPTGFVMVRLKEESDRFVGSHEYSLDGNGFQRVEDHEIGLGPLAHGEHELLLRSVDVFGYASEVFRVPIRIDDIVPRFTVPIPEEEKARSSPITWNWTPLVMTASEVRYAVKVLVTPIGSDRQMLYKEAAVLAPSFTLDGDIPDGSRYHLEVEATSLSGLRYSSRSTIPVTIDRTPPTPPDNVVLENDPLDPFGMVLTWGRSWDNQRERNATYIVEVLSQDGEWKFLCSTDGTGISYRRSVGESPQFRVRGMDDLGNIGDASRSVSIGNRFPEAVLAVTEEPWTGRFVLDSSRSYDPDGRISQRLWEIDSVPVSMEEVFRLYLDEGRYVLDLTVTDDLGSQTRQRYHLILDRGQGDACPEIHATLVEMSREIRYRNGTKIHYNNLTEIVIEEDHKEGWFPERSEVMDLFMISSIVLMFLLMAFSGTSLVLSGIDRRRMSKAEFVMEINPRPRTVREAGRPSIVDGKGPFGRIERKDGPKGGYSR